MEALTEGPVLQSDSLASCSDPLTQPCDFGQESVICRVGLKQTQTKRLAGRLLIKTNDRADMEPLEQARPTAATAGDRQH